MAYEIIVYPTLEQAEQNLARIPVKDPDGPTPHMEEMRVNEGIRDAQEHPYQNLDEYPHRGTIATMNKLEEQKGREIPFLAAEHSDHAPHRHLHVLALVRGTLNPSDFRALRETATTAALMQRQERDLAREALVQQALIREEVQWAI